MNRWILSLITILFGVSLHPWSAAVNAQTFEGKLLSGDIAFGDTLGEVLSVSGDTIVLGARLDGGGIGAMYVFRRNGGGTWSQEDKLIGSGAAAQDQVGHDVAVAGDLALAGAPDPFDPFGGASGAGTVYVFRRTGSSWSQEASFSSLDGQSTDQFGSAVEVSGTAAVVGASGDEASGLGSRFLGRGAAYVFRNSGSSWSQEDKLVGSDSVSGDLLGSAADIDGDYVLLGAPGDDDSGSESGSAYVFENQGGGNWTQQDKLLASDGSADDGFGDSAAISGDVAVVGAFRHDASGADAGAVYVFRRSGSTWNQEAKLQASDAAADAYFGASVDVVGDRLIVGAYGAEAVYLFENVGGSTWSETAKLTVAGATLLGRGVAMTNEFVVAGAPLENLSGAGYVWGVNPGPTLTSISPATGLFNQATAVSLSGTDFSAVTTTSVTFGGVAATTVNVVSDTEITCVAPTGSQGQVVDVTLTQDGTPSTLSGAFTYVGTSITSISPSSGPVTGAPPATITGDFFVNDGSTVVTFGGLAANVVSVTEPNSIVVDVPVGTRGTTVDVTVSSTNGVDTLVGGYTYENLGILALDIGAATMVGGTVLSLDIDFPTNLADTSATLGGAPVTVQSLTGSTVEIITPAVVEPSGAALDITITNSNGTATLADAFFHTPALLTTVTGNTTSGVLGIDWRTDETVLAPQFITLWLGDPLIAPIGAPVAGYAGLIQRVPLFFILEGVPSTINPLNLPFGPIPASIAGFPLFLEGLVTGEGGAFGAFTNASMFSIPL